VDGDRIVVSVQGLPGTVEYVSSLLVLGATLPAFTITEEGGRAHPARGD
jgi:hypothetical protein